MNNLFDVLAFFGGIPTFFILFLIFIFIFRHNMHKNSHAHDYAQRTFWQHEKNSLVVRKKEIPLHYYISINNDAVPNFTKAEYDAFNQGYLYTIQESLSSLQETKMMDLSNLLNSDIRMQFGTANLPFVEQYENNYLNCIKNIYKLGKGLYENGFTDEALTLLEEGLNVGSDLSHHYLLMISIYKSIDKPYLIDDLITNLKNKEHDKFTKIIDLLEENAESYS